MLGWAISVARFGSAELRQARGDVAAMRALLVEATGSEDVPERTADDPLIAVWQSWLGGINWVRELVDQDRALPTVRTGYPDTYLVLCQDFKARLEAGLPSENKTWALGYGDIITDRWLGETKIDEELLAQCPPDEWLIVEAAILAAMGETPQTGGAHLDE